MSHPIPFSNDSVTGKHPAFCCPCCCETTATDTNHRSAPVSLRLRDAKLHLSWVCSDEHAFPDEEPMPELQIDIIHGMEGNDSTLYLAPWEIRRLIDQLTEQYYRQQLNAPATPEAVATA